MAEGLTTPQAILLGSAIIGICAGLGIYFGRTRAASSPREATSLQNAIASAEPSGLASQKEVAERASAALETQKKRLTERCWKPFFDGGGPAKASFVLNFTFAADGSQITRGMTTDRAAYNTDVTRCLGENLEPVKIPAPGANVYVEVPFTLP